MAALTQNSQHSTKDAEKILKPQQIIDWKNIVHAWCCYTNWLWFSFDWTELKRKALFNTLVKQVW